jgi:hypothetical protein
MRAVFAEPTKEIASTSGESIRASTASRPPWTRLTTPGGKISCSAISSRMRTEVSGSCSEGDHRREVERGDRPDHADRLADHLDVDALGDAFEVLPLHQVGDRDRRLDRLDPTTDLAERVGEGLAHVAGDERGELLTVGVEDLAELHEVTGADLRRDLAPGALRGLGGRRGGCDGGGTGERHVRDRLAGGGIAVEQRLHRVDLDPGAGDVVAEGGDGRRGDRGALGHTDHHRGSQVLDQGAPCACRSFQL